MNEADFHEALEFAREHSNGLRREIAVLTQRLDEANKVIEGYVQDEPPIVKGALDAQAEAERMFYEVRGEAVKLRAEVAELKATVEQVTEERDRLKSAYALARCSWCDELVCEKHAEPGKHLGCGAGEPEFERIR